MRANTASDSGGLLRDTLREALFSWRFPATLGMGLAFGLLEQHYTSNSMGLVFGLLAGLYTLFLGPLPWRLLVPLEADGDRGRKLVRWAMAAGIALVLFWVLALPYALTIQALDLRSNSLFVQPREIVVSTLLFLVGGWGLARDVQLEQRLDRSNQTREQLAAELEEARLYALRADLDPHFLFNALNAIASQCTSDPTGAEDNIVRLSSLLRAVLDTRARTAHPLEEELGLVRAYLGLLSARFPALKYELETDTAPGELLVPPLLLQPLLENAVRHGRVEQGVIVLRIARTSEAMAAGWEFLVRSPGVFRGFREGSLGLELVRRRAELAWGARAEFSIQTDGNDTLARLLVRDS